MKIISLYAENVLNLRAVSITADRRVTRITGANGAGKSNVLNAMYYALAGKKAQAEQPIRLGTQKATVRLALGDEAVKLNVILRITESGSYLDVESPEGARFKSPQAMLEALVGNLTFDPQAFSRMKPQDRLETLRELVPLGIDLDKLDTQNEKDFVMRTDWNRRVKSLVDRVAQLHAGVDESDVTPVDVDALMEQMANASNHNAQIDAERGERNRKYQHAMQTARMADECYERARDLRRQADLIEKEGDKHAADAHTMKSAVENAPTLADHLDVQSLRVKINEAMAANATRDAQRRQRETLKGAVAELEAARTMSKNLSDAIDARDKQKADAIAAAKMPIEGLGFGNGDVTFGGLPFTQASTGAQLRIATAIGMALNPKLRVLFVRDGSLLDNASREILEAMAEEQDFQLWIEATQDNPTVGIHIVDGAIAAVDGVPVPAAGDDAQRSETAPELQGTV